MSIRHFLKNTCPKSQYSEAEIQDITKTVINMTPAEQIKYVINHISIGNKKIGKDTMILNMQPALKCSSALLGLCKHAEICYAKKAEVLYNSTYKFRQRQEIIWNNITGYFIFMAIEKIIEKKNKGKNKIKYFRFSESGDFPNLSSVDKMANIAKLLKTYHGVLTYGYTARRDLPMDNIRQHAIVNGSDYMMDNMFTAVDKFDSTISPFLCSGDCSTCNLCKRKSGIIIQVKKH